MAIYLEDHDPGSVKIGEIGEYCWLVSLRPHVRGSCFVLQNSCWQKLCSHKECCITTGKTTFCVSAARKYMHMYASKTPFSSVITNTYSVSVLQAQKHSERHRLGSTKFYFSDETRVQVKILVNCELKLILYPLVSRTTHAKFLG